MSGSVGRYSSRLLLAVFCLIISLYAFQSDVRAQPRDSEAPPVLAYVGQDGNIWLWEGRTGTAQKITDDGVARYADGRQGSIESVPWYGSPAWSPDGRMLVFARVESIGQYAIFSGPGESYLSLWDAASNNQALLVEGWAPAWSPDGSKLSFSGPSLDPVFEERNLSIYDRVTGSITTIGEPIDASSFPPLTWSPDGMEVVFGSLEAGVAVADARTGRRVRTLVPPFERAGPGPFEMAAPLWSPDGTSVAVIVASSNAGPPGGAIAIKEEAAVIDVASGAIKTLSPEMYRSGDLEYLAPERWGTWSSDSSQFFFVSEGSGIWVWNRASGETRQVADDDSASYFSGLAVSTSGRWLAYGSGIVYGSSEELVIYDLQNTVEVTRLVGGDPAWQPRVLPPVLFVHGCGGSLGTWTDPGWIANTKEIAKLTSGQASGALHRGTIPDLPAVPAYALDYGRSEGSIWDLAALLPQSIDKIAEETGAEEVMVVTHSMGGVLTQAYVGGLATGRRFENDVEAAFMVAPPSRGAFVSNWLTGLAGNELVCPQASELGPNSQSMARLRSASLPQLDYAVISGTRLWYPFVGLNDGIVADHDVGLRGVGYNKRQVRGIHTDISLLPNTVGALCLTVVNDPCPPELRMPEVQDAFRQRYAEDMFE